MRFNDYYINQLLLYKTISILSIQIYSNFQIFSKYIRNQKNRKESNLNIIFK